MKYNLLFVDDEAQILEGIQDSLRKYREQWNMTFVCGGEAAIVEMTLKKYDVIICDMRMPQVDGVDVLTYAKVHFPETIRIVLSGYAETENTIIVSSLAHRYLTKPCDKSELEAVIQGCMEVSGKLKNTIVKNIAGSIDLLPVNDEHYQRILEQLDNDKTPLSDIAETIETDIALTSKLLHLVNSAFFRRQRKIDSVKEAAAYLGADLVKSMVIANQFFTVAENLPNIDPLWVSRLQQHSWFAASIAKKLMSDTEHAEAAFTATLLHEVGLLALAAERSDLLSKLLESNEFAFYHNENTSEDNNSQISNSMQEELGAYLLNLWGMPFNIVEAVAFYKQPSEREYDGFDIVGAVHVANYLAEICMTGHADDFALSTLDEAYLERVGQAGKMENWLQVALETAEECGLENLIQESLKAA